MVINYFPVKILYYHFFFSPYVISLNYIPHSNLYIFILILICFENSGERAAGEIKGRQLTRKVECETSEGLDLHFDTTRKQ